MGLKRSKKLKRIVSGMLSLVMITNMSAVLPASAEEESSQGMYSLTDNDNGNTNGEDSVSDDVVTDEEDTIKIKKGDVNGDGYVHEDDRDLLHKWLVRLVGDNALDLEKADVNMDGKVDIKDLVELRKLETHDQIFKYEVENDDCAVTEVQVSMDCTGDLNETMQIESIMDEDPICSEVVGLVGEPFSIETTSEFDNATITFKVDQEKLGDTEFEDLIFLWYDRENDNFVEIDTEHDAANSTVSIETTHFSPYMVTDYEAWRLNWDKIAKETCSALYWQQAEEYPSDYPSVNFAIIESNTEAQIDPLTEAFDGSTMCTRRTIIEYLTSFMSSSQYYYFIRDYEYTAGYYKKNIFNDSIDSIWNTIRTNYKIYKEPRNLLMTLDCFNASSLSEMDPTDISILLISDDYVLKPQYVYSTYEEILSKNDFVLYIVDLRDGYDKTLDSIAKSTNGEYLKNTPEDIEHLKKIITNPNYKFLCEDGKYYSNYKDSDGDGFSDLEEINGWMYTSNGRKIESHTDPKSKDSDGDNLDDNVEMDPKLTEEQTIKFPYVKKYYHHMYSDPSKWDTDDDDLRDDIDEFPLKPFVDEFIPIVDSCIDDTGSINGYNTPLYEPYSGWEKLREQNGSLNLVNIDGSPISYDSDKDTPKKNEYIFTRVRKSNADAKFSITPDKNSDFAFTITNTNETKLGEEYNPEEYNPSDYISDVEVYLDGQHPRIVPVDIKINDDGTEITYVFALEAGKDYKIYIDNKSRISDPDERPYEIHVSEDNWVHAPDGGIRYRDCFYIDGEGDVYDYVDVFFSNSILIKMLNSKFDGNPDWSSLHYYDSNNSPTIAGIANFFFDDEKTLGINKNKIVDYLTATSYCATVLGVLPGGEIFGLIVGGTGLVSTAAVIYFDNHDCQKFEEDLMEAFRSCIENPNGEVSLCYTHYKYDLDPLSLRTVNTWTNWSRPYIHKYEDGKRFEVETGIDYKVFDLADQ